MTIGVPMRGTRGTSQLTQSQHPSGRSIDRSLNTDPGLTKNVTASITFVNGATKQLQAANGTFAAFAVGDDLLVEGSLSGGVNNDGVYLVTAIDGANQSFLTVDNSPKNAGPVTCTVRTA